MRRWPALSLCLFLFQGAGEKGVRPLLPERPGGCCAQKGPDPFFAGEQDAASWKAGVAKVIITPEQLMWMSGYGARTKPAEGKLHDLWAKALLLEDPDGRRGVLVTMDLVGIPRDLSQAVCVALKRKFELPR